MNLKNFIVGGIVGGIINYLLGWLLWGILFKDSFQSDPEKMNMLFIFLGCMTTGFFLSYIYIRWAHISTLIGGLVAGAIIGLFMGLNSVFFGNESVLEPNMKLLVLNLALMITSTSITGAVIGLVFGKMK